MAKPKYWSNQTSVTGNYFGTSSKKKKEEEEKKKGVKATQNLKDKTFSAGASSKGSYKNYGNKGESGAQGQTYKSKNYGAMGQAGAQGQANTKQPVKQTIETPDRRESVANKHKGQSYSINSQGYVNRGTAKSYTFNKSDNPDELKRLRSEAATEEKGSYLINSANDPNYKDTKAGKQQKENIKNYEISSKKDYTTSISNFNTEEDDARKKQLSVDTSLNRVQGSYNFTKKQYEKESASNQRKWDTWINKTDNFTEKTPLDYQKAVEAGRAQNILNTNSYGASQDVIDHINYLFGSGREDLAREGIELLQKSYNMNENLKTKQDELNRAYLKQNENVANNFKNEADLIQKKIDKIESGVRTGADDNEITALRKKKSEYEALARDFSSAAEWDKNVSLMQYEMQSDPEYKKYIEKGRAMDDYLIDKNNADWWDLYTGMSVSDDENAIKAAMLAASPEEEELYYAIEGKYGKDAAYNYAKTIYGQYREDENGNTFGGLGDRFANYAGEKLDNPAGNTLQAFAAGAQNSIFGLRDAFTRITGDESVHVDGLMNKIYQQNVQEGRLNKVVGDVVYNIGNMMPAIAVSIGTMGIASPAAAGAISASVTGLSSFGNTYQQARREGFDSEGATAYAVLNGVSEAALQYALNGVGAMAGGFTTEALAGTVSEAVGKTISNPVGKYVATTLIKQCINSSGEFIEEYLQEVLDPVFRNWALGEDNEFQPFSADALYAGLLGMLSASVMNSVDVAGNQIRIVKDGRMFTTSKTTDDIIDGSLDLPETFEAKKSAEYFQNNNKTEDGKVKLNSMEAGLLFQQYQQAESVMAEIEEAVQNGKITWNGLSDEARTTLVDPRNAEYLAKEYGLEIDANMQPSQIASAVRSHMNNLDIEAGRTAISSTKSDGSFAIEIDNNRRTTYNRISDETGISIFSEDMAPVPKRDTKGEIMLDENGEPIMVDPAGYLVGDKLVINSKFINSDEGITRVLVHEITHASEMSQYYGALSKSVIKMMKAQGTDINQAIQDKIDDYESVGRSLTKEGAMAEIVAEFSENTFFKDVNSLVNFLSDNKTLGQKIMDWFQAKRDKAEPKSPEQKMLDQALNNFRKAFNEVSETDAFLRLMHQDTLSVEGQFSIHTKKETGMSVVQLDRTIEESDVEGQPHLKRYIGKTIDSIPKEAKWFIEDNEELVNARERVARNMFSKLLDNTYSAIYDNYEAAITKDENSDENEEFSYSTEGKMFETNMRNRPEFNEDNFLEKKLRLNIHLDEIFEASVPYYSKADMKSERHGKFADKGFRTRLALIENGGSWFFVPLKIAVDNNGNAVMYTIDENEGIYDATIKEAAAFINHKILPVKFRDGFSRGQLSIRTEPSKQFDPRHPNARDLIHTERQNIRSAPKDLRKSIESVTDIIKRKTIDSMASYEAVDRAIGGRAVYNAANNARSARQAAAFSIGRDVTGQKAYQADFLGQEIWVPKRDINRQEVIGEDGKPVMMKCKSLNDIWAPVYERTKTDPEYNKDFQYFLRLMDNADRVALGHGTLPSEQIRNVRGKKKLRFMTTKESLAKAMELLEKHPEFEEMADEVWAYNLNNLQYQLDAGIISQEDFDNITSTHPHYVPADRDVDTSMGQTKYDTNPVRSSTGRAVSLPFIPVDEAMANQTQRYVMAAKRNFMLSTLYSAYEAHSDKIGNFVTDAQVAPQKGIKKIADHQMTIEELEAMFDEQDIDGVTERKNTVTFYRNGQKITMTVSDGIYEGYTELYKGMSDVEKVVGAPTRAMGTFFRNFVTNYNPTFIATNFLKDFGDAIFYTQNTPKFLKNFGRAWKQITSNGAIWNLYKANGGFSSSFFEVGDNMGKQRNAFQRYFLDKIEKINLFVEQAPRLAEFMTSLEMNGMMDAKGNLSENGLNIEAMRQAMFDANDITVNFGRSGTVTKKINRSLVPFLNASVQGASKIARQFQRRGGKAWLNLATKAAVLGVLPAVLNSLMYKDDDEWKHMTDWNKDNNYMFKLGDGKWLCIPRGRFMSFFAGLGNRAVQAMNGDNVDWSGMGEVIETNIAPANPLTNNIVAPIFRVANNQTWYGGSIDSYEDLKKRPEDRYDESTSWIFKGIGQAIGQSPKRVQTLFEDYTGFIGDVLVPATDKKGGQFWDGMASKFIKDSAYSNDFGSTFNAYKEELDTLINYEGYSEVPSILKYKQKYINAQSSKISALYDDISALQNSNASDKDKTEGSRAIRMAISGSYEAAIANAELLEKTMEKYYKVDENASIDVQKRQAKEAYVKAMTELFGAEEGLKAAGFKQEDINDLKEKGISLNDYFAYYNSTHSGDKYYSSDEDGKAQNYSYAEKKEKLMAIGMDKDNLKAIYKNEFENENTKAEKSIDYATTHGVSVNDFIKTVVAFDKIGKSDDDADKSKTLQKKEWLLNNIKDEKAAATLYAMNFESDSVDKFNTISYARSHGVSTSSFIKREIQKSSEEGEKSGEVSVDYVLEDGKIVEKTSEKYLSGSKLVKAMDNMLKSGYSDKEIEYFYQREYGSDDAFIWAVKSGMKAKDYIKYRQETAMITADKDANGNSISGSKKQKMFDAINSLDMSKVQKLMLFMRDYKLSESQYREVFAYINSLSLSTSEKLQLAEGLGFLVRDGKVYMKKAS